MVTNIRTVWKPRRTWRVEAFIQHVAFSHCSAPLLTAHPHAFWKKGSSSSVGVTCHVSPLGGNSHVLTEEKMIIDWIQSWMQHPLFICSLDDDIKSSASRDNKSMTGSSQDISELPVAFTLGYGLCSDFMFGSIPFLFLDLKEAKARENKPCLGTSNHVSCWIWMIEILSSLTYMV